MKRQYIVLIVMMCAGFFNLYAQNTYKGPISFGEQKVARNGGTVTVEVKADLSGVELGSQRMILLTPVLQSKDKANSYEFPPAVVAGKQRYKALMRSLDFGTRSHDDRETSERKTTSAGLSIGGTL